MQNENTSVLKWVGLFVIWLDGKEDEKIMLGRRVLFEKIYNSLPKNKVIQNAEKLWRKGIKVIGSGDW